MPHLEMPSEAILRRLECRCGSPNLGSVSARETIYFNASSPPRCDIPISHVPITTGLNGISRRGFSFNDIPSDSHGRLFSGALRGIERRLDGRLGFSDIIPPQSGSRARLAAERDFDTHA